MGAPILGDGHPLRVKRRHSYAPMGLPAPGGGHPLRANRPHNRTTTNSDTNTSSPMIIANA